MDYPLRDQKCLFFGTFWNVKFPVKKSFFPIQNINKPSFLTWLYQKKQDEEEVPVFDKNHGLSS